MMNLRNRFLCTLRGERADRVPLDLDGFQFADRAQVAALRDPGQREIAERVFEHCHAFLFCPSHLNRYFCTPPQFIHEVDRREELGDTVITSEIRTPQGPLTVITGQNPAAQTVWTIKYPVESLQDIVKIRSLPWELPEGLSPPSANNLTTERPMPWELPSGIESSATSAEDPAIRERCVVRAEVSSPSVCVAGMMSFQHFLELCVTHLDLLLELSQECMQRTLQVMDVLLAERSVDYLFIGGCEWLTPPMGSPRLYEQLVQQFEAPLIARAHKAGAVVHVHSHGKVRSTLEQVVQRGADFFEPVEPPPDGDILFSDAKRLVRGRMTLGGNIEARILERENADQVKEAVFAAFEGNRERMVLKPTSEPICALNPRMLENYHRLIDVWEECSPL
jgi:hypothetical protein